MMWRTRDAAHGPSVFFRGREDVPRIVMVVAQLYKYAKTMELLSSKQMHHMVCELYPDEAVIKSTNLRPGLALV